jgi:hypothetical protein
MRRTLATLAVLLCTTALTAGCGGDEPASTAKTKQITITFDGDSVTPNGERVEVSVGQPVELVVEADEPGEIHVHSSPELELEYQAGSSTLDLEPIDKPGVIDVESHTLEKTIVQLEVR